MQLFQILKKLPNYYNQTPVLKSVAGLLEQSPVRFSGIFIKQKGKHFLVLKDGHNNVDLDWEAFSIMRASSNLIITSGAIIRQQPGLFLKPQSYGNPHVEELYEHFLNGRSQKLYVVSKQQSKENLLKEINKKYYQFIEKIQLNSIYELFNRLYKDKSNHPISIQVGLKIINQYFNEVDKGATNFLDTLMISTFQGPLEQKYIGEQLKIDFDKYYSLVWKSQKLQCSTGSGKKGSLTIQFYRNKI